MDQRTSNRRRMAMIAGGLVFALACNRVEVAPQPDPPQAAAAIELPETDTPSDASDLTLRLSLDERFQLDRQEGPAMVLRLLDVPDIELWLAVGRDPVGGAVPSQEALVERARSFLEPIHGEVEVSTTAAGDSLLAFSGPKPDGNRTLYTWNWLVLRPGDRDVLRADISLRVPGPWAGRPEMKGLAEHVAERLAGAEFEPSS